MRKSSIVDDLFFLPWWVSLVFGGVIYSLLRLGLPAMASDNTIQLVIYQGLSSLAGLVASLFVIISVAAAIRQFKVGELFREQATTLNLSTISWHQFEELVGEAYRRMGYQVTGNTCGGADGGIDLMLRKGGEKTLVQCKHWKSSQVGVSIIREHYGVMCKEQADHGIVVCSGRFTEDAIAFAKGLPLDLVDGARLKKLIVLPKAVRKQAPVYNPLCPTCSGGMVMRKASKGRFAGQNFMGCKRFPKCRGTRKA